LTLNLSSSLDPLPIRKCSKYNGLPSLLCRRNIVSVWFPRDFQRLLGEPALPVRVLVGPRQCGKSALLARLLPDAIWLSLDDLDVRVRAQEDPALLLDSASTSDAARPIVVDEAAYAPNLFPEIKRRIDVARRAGLVEPSFWLTGSNRVLLDGAVRESLAGRATYYALHTLGVSELAEHAEIGDWLLRGGFPELYVRRELSPSRYLEDYVRTFVEKDVAVTAGVSRLHEFRRALRLLAARTGQALNATDVGQLAGVKGQTITTWLALLEQNALAFALPPYHSNLSKRLVRTPKLYFLDTGLAAFLQGWRALEPLLASPQVGALFENLVLGELVRARDHRGLSLNLQYFRTKEGDEVDFLVEAHGARGTRWFAIEAKFAIQRVEAVAPPRALRALLPEIEEVWVVTPGGDEAKLSASSRRVPITRLADRIEAALA
jgi:predicted AAA+ superfamily ATPase